MPTQDQDFQSAHEMGKIYNSIVDKKILCDFFLESVFPFVGASQGFLFLTGVNDQLWMESFAGASLKQPPKSLEADARAVQQSGKPATQDGCMLLPLMARNTVIGVACFQKSGDGAFTPKELEIGFDLTSQFAGALKNTLLFEENLKMERLAAVGQTISMVMHEIKNIIQIAKLADELIRRGIRDKNEKFITHGLEGTAKAIHEMDGFVWDMLSLSKDYRIDPRKISIQSVLQELHKDLHERAKQLQIELDFQVEEPFPEVDGEDRSMYRALLNLVQNAMDACTKDNSYIRIRVRSVDEDSYQIVIEDNGHGMPADVKARIFQAFFSTKGKKGNGLGLMIIDRTIKAHRGKLQLESEVDKGTTFTLTMPKNLPRD